MRHYKIAVMPGDGIGPEVITEGVAVLREVAELHGGVKFETQDYDWGSERYLRHGAMMPPDALKVLEAGGFNAILVGHYSGNARRPRPTDEAIQGQACFQRSRQPAQASQRPHAHWSGERHEASCKIPS